MLSELVQSNYSDAIILRKSFTDTLCEGYLFGQKEDLINPGTRSVFYYQAEHSLLVSHVSSNRVHVINFLTGKIRWFDHHGTTVRNLHVRNHEIISAGWDGRVCVTNFDTLKARLILTEPNMGRCPEAIISPDGRFAYSYTYDSDKNPACTTNIVRKWSLADGELMNVFNLSGTHIGGRRCGACSILNNRLYIVSSTGYLEVFNCSTDQKENGFFFNDEFQSICASPFSNNVLFAGNKGDIYTYDTNAQEFTQFVKAHNHDVTELLVHPENPEILFSISFDGTLKIWELPGLKLIGSVDVQRNYLWTLTIVNDLLLTGGDEGQIWVYDIKDLSNVVLKGKIVVLDQSYLYLPVGSSTFYTSDPDNMQVSKAGTGEPLTGQYADYLLNSCNNFRLFQHLFSSKSPESQSIEDGYKIRLQIPQSFS